MSSTRLTLSIGDREVIPIRAIPYVTGWDISPDEVARSLARTIRGGFPNRLENVVAYHIGQDAQTEVLPKEWDDVSVRLKSLEAQLRECFPNDDVGYSEWRKQSAEELPTGVFVFREDFERAYQGTLPLRLEDRPGDDELNYSPMLANEVGAMVLEGFQIHENSGPEGVLGLLKLSSVPGLLALLRYPDLPEEQDLIVPSVMRVDAEDSFKSLLKRAILEGHLVQRDHVGIPIPSHRQIWHGGYVLRAGLQHMLDVYSVPIQLDEPPEIESKSSTDERLKAQHANQKDAKRLAGRYTLEEAAKVLESEAGERVETVLSRLVKAAKERELPMYNPGEKFARNYGDERTKTVRDFYEEAHWDDLNKWLKNYAPRIEYVFRAPSDIDANETVTILHPNLTPRIPKAKRRDTLWPAIDKAIGNAGSKDVPAVWLALKELALDEERPFDGNVDDDLLKYTDGRKKKGFSRASLRQRLRRLEKSTA